MEPNSLLSCLQESATGSFTETCESGPRPYILLIWNKFVFILPSMPIPFRFTIENLYEILIFYISTSSAYLVCLDLFLLMLGKEYKYEASEKKSISKLHVSSSQIQNTYYLLQFIVILYNDTSVMFLTEHEYQNYYAG